MMTANAGALRNGWRNEAGSMQMDRERETVCQMLRGSFVFVGHDVAAAPCRSHRGISTLARKQGFKRKLALTRTNF